MTEPLRIGELLVQSGVLTEAALAEVLERQKVDRRRLGDILAERNLVEPRRLAQILSYQMSCPWLSLTNVDLQKSLIDLVPRELAIKHTLVPVHLRDKNGQTYLYVATHDPTDLPALAEIEAYVKMPVRPMVAITYEIRTALNRYYGAPIPSLTTAPRDFKPVTLPVAIPNSANVHTAITQKVAPAKPPPPPGAAAPPPVPKKVPPPPPPPPPPPEQLGMGGIGGALTVRFPIVLLLNAPEKFREQCALAAKGVGATVAQGTLTNASDKVKELKPAAIVVTDDIYGFDRAGLNRLAIESDALLVVWSEDVEASQLHPLLDGAMRRLRRSS